MQHQDAFLVCDDVLVGVDGFGDEMTTGASIFG